MSYQCISVAEAKELMDNNDVCVVDIRDQTSFRQGHIHGALHLHNGNIGQFLADADFDKPLIVCCYHGHSSQGTAAYLVGQGIEEVFSMDGGFEVWKTQFDVEIS